MSLAVSQTPRSSCCPNAGGCQGTSQAHSNVAASAFSLDRCSRSEGELVAALVALGTCSGAAQERRQQGLLGMQTVFGLIKDAAVAAFHGARADLQAAVGRQAVQHD